jgi:hypothetical protein
VRVFRTKSALLEQEPNQENEADKAQGAFLRRFLDTDHGQFGSLTLS